MVAAWLGRNLFQTLQEVVLFNKDSRQLETYWLWVAYDGFPNQLKTSVAFSFWIASNMIESPDFTLSVYGISGRRGFLPDDLPAQHLEDPYFRPWESIMAELPDLIQSNELRTKVDVLPKLDTVLLKNEVEWKRAYVVLSFLTHAYIWGGRMPAQRLPPSLSVPFSNVANHFALPTTATYAALNLWNWKPTASNADITIPENVEVLNTFTGTKDEAWFYLISVSIEAKGALAIPVMLESIEAVRVNNATMVLESLNKITNCLRELGAILNRMYERCDPMVFYHRIRPFLAGSRGMAGAGLPHGVFYDEGDGHGSWRQYSGGSNAQSSLIQLFDIVLGVEHHGSGGAILKSKESYLLEMRNYMPGAHRHFLTHISSVANLRQYVLREECESTVRYAYQAALQSLTAFRDKHIRIVSRYIIAPAQQSKSNATSGQLNIATFTSNPRESGQSKKVFSGTGGTTLMPFLKQSRDETKNAGILQDDS